MMFLLVVLCFVFLSPYVMGSVKNCTATKCLSCSSSVTPNCTLSQIDQWLYNVYCEPPITPECTDINVTNAYCIAFVDIDNNNGQWIYQGLRFPFQNHHTDCSNVFFNGNPLTPNCLHLYSEVTSVENVGHNIVCPCYEDDCQKRVNITFRVIGNIITSSSSSSLISPTTSSITVDDDRTPLLTTSSISANNDRTPSLTTSSISANNDRTPSLTTSSSSDHDTLISQSLQTPLSIVSISTSIYSNDLPSNILRNPNSLEGPLNIVMGVLAFAVFLTGILLFFILFCYCYKQFSKRKQDAVLSTLEMTKFQANY